eukprot:SAG25_NODE_2881_length_1337_cov_0.927302_1_plen_136_part_01
MVALPSEGNTAVTAHMRRADGEGGLLSPATVGAAVDSLSRVIRVDTNVIVVGFAIDAMLRLSRGGGGGAHGERAAEVARRVVPPPSQGSELVLLDGVARMLLLMQPEDDPPQTAGGGGRRRLLGVADVAGMGSDCE